MRPFQLRLCLLLAPKAVCSSSFTGASNPGNDGSSVFSVAYSKRLVLASHTHSGTEPFDSPFGVRANHPAWNNNIVVISKVRRSSIQ